MAHAARPAGEGSNKSERGTTGESSEFAAEEIFDREATETASSAAKLELERMNQVLEQRVREHTAELEAAALRQAEAELRLYQVQKMEVFGHLTVGLAHDFNNILQVIIGSLEIIKITLQRSAPGEHGGDRRAVVDRATATAQRAAEGAKQLVQRLLAFSRLQPLAPAALDVNALVGEMTEIIERALGATTHVETALDAGVGSVHADRNQLESVLLNLVIIARDAMPQGGRLFVETVNVDCSETGPDDLASGRYVMLSVRDTGCGSSREHLKRVFEPLFTTKDAGREAGPGLPMVYGFVKRSGEQVRIYSTDGSGTTVKIYLPCSPQEGAAAQEASPATPRTTPSK